MGFLQMNEVSEWERNKNTPIERIEIEGERERERLGDGGVSIRFDSICVAKGLCIDKYKWELI